MGSLASHMAGFILLFPIGLRRLISSYSLHLRSPSHPFLPKPWYFSSTSSPQSNNNYQHHYLIGNLDLYFLLVALPIASFSELFLFLTIPSSSPTRLTFSHQSASLALFWLLLLSLSVLSLPDSLSFLLSSLAFLCNFFLSSGPVITTSSPIEAKAYALLRILTGICAAACLVMAMPVRKGGGAFAADVSLSAAMVLKGTWALQVGALVFGLPPAGCQQEKGVLSCELEENMVRGVAMVETLFVVHAVVVAAVCLAAFGAVAWYVNRTAGAATLADGEIMRPMMMSDFETLD